MNFTKILFSLASVLSLSIGTLVYFLYQEHKQISQYSSSVSALGHELIEVRDAVINHALSPQLDPYFLNAEIVNLEKESKDLLTHYQETSKFGLYKKQTSEVMTLFHQSLLRLSETLDKVVGLIIVKDALLTSVLEHIELGTESSSLERDAMAKKIHQNSKLDNIPAKLESTVSTFKQVDTQRRELFTALLSPQNSEFVEHTEKQLRQQAISVQNKVFQLLATLAIVVSAFVIYTYVHRLQELKRNNHAYQEAIDRTEKANHAKSIFLATMSHELRTPMSGVLGVAQMIRDDTNESRTKEHADIIINSGNHLVTLLNDILDFSKVEEGKLELEHTPFSLRELVQPLESTLLPLAQKKNITLTIPHYPSDDLKLVGDVARTRQLLFNLIGNAIKFTQQGKVEVNIQINDSGSVGVLFTVTDTGIGIEDDKLNNIFIPFEQAELSTTRKFGGTGLGLSIVKKLVDLMEGEISVSSRVGYGSKFDIFLPLEVQQDRVDLSNIEEASLNNTEHLHKKRILLVEDNRVNAVVAKGFLKDYAQDITWAEDGLQALEVLENEQFDLIVIDNHMPNLSGVETIKRIRETLKLDTVIFAYTADVFKEAHDSLIDAGANFVLTKPLQKPSLELALKQFSREIMASSHQEIEGSTVVPLIRHPASQLALTEEELSASSSFNDPSLSRVTKLELLIGLKTKLNALTDQLIEAYSSSSLELLIEALSQIETSASELELEEVLALAKVAKESCENSELPNVEHLQQLINRMLVNLHQAQRLTLELSHSTKQA
ncbi:ATP-binding protein [Vibrio tubiashii]|uniref:histidine kinase n=1 Tax=Vibrio tubiashii ATCC 19109 TaxID=1051646 RepID=F9T8W9_9VIBR|nr:ATP-binding protein [Vibrio tubiashii]AIW14270.1 histidine kinase [Vibrio tubiashii ATCC 19109]EGU52059.1 putative sensor histidine kinase [Vibrio tubiashii ATCC 19109]EIF03829.1 sensor histidine kinase [Vibrio tubiashii NCIMB 1337 = ATCC 19106]